MRIEAQKLLFIGPESGRAHFLHTCQKAGLVEFSEPKGFLRNQLSAEVTRYELALKIIRPFTSAAVPSAEKIEPNLLAADILFAYEEIAKLNAQEKELLQELDKLAPFGSFSQEDIVNLHVTLWSARHSLHFMSDPKFQQSSTAFISFGVREGVEYFACFDPLFTPSQELQAYMQPVKWTRAPQELRKDLELCRNNRDVLYNRIKEAACHEKQLRAAFFTACNKEKLETAKAYANSSLEGALFFIEGWAAKKDLPRVHALAQEASVIAEEVLAHEHEVPPTILSNKGLHRVGEDLIRIFDTPSHKDKDPSFCVYFFFSLFFAMIVGDGGYGVVLLSLAFFLRKKHLPTSGLGKRLFKLCVTLGISCVLWGLCTHSFFGIPLQTENPLRKYSLVTNLITARAQYHMQTKDPLYQEFVVAQPGLLDAKTPQDFLYSPYSLSPTGKPIYDLFSDNLFFELALFVGVLHILFGMARYLFKNPHLSGWILFLIGAYCYIPVHLKATSLLNYAFGFTPAQLSYIGFDLVCYGPLLATAIAIFQNGFLGVFEIMTAVQVFADVLSYLRLYALALAGSIVSSIINQTIPSLPFAAMLVVVVFAHATNLLLGIIGGIIHGLRLNFLEWYHYSFEGGGREFQPLSLMEVSHGGN